MTGTDQFVLWIAGAFAAASLFILVLLGRAMLRRSGGGVPGAGRAVSRQALSEALWPLAPVVIFALIAVPSLRLIYLRNASPPADMTINMTGNMWFWTFEYPDHGHFRFSSPMLTGSERPGAGAPGSGGLAQDHIMVPVGKVVRIVAQPGSVIYSWSLPTLSAKINALPGRTSQSWFTAAEEGRHVGQCLELCGLPHDFNPIEVEVVSQERFDRWVLDARHRYASAGAPGDPSLSTVTD